MQFKKNQVKRLKTLTSLDTEATMLEYNESNLKTSSKTPKAQKNNHLTQKIQIVEQPDSLELSKISHQKPRNWLKVPQMLSKHKENSLFDTYHFQIMLQSQNQDAMQNMIRNSSKSHENASQQLNSASLVMLLNSESKSSYYKNQEQNQTFLHSGNTKAPKYEERSQKQRDPLQFWVCQRQFQKLKRADTDMQINQVSHEEQRREQHNSPKLLNKDISQLNRKVNLGNHYQSKCLKLRDYMLKTQISRKKAFEQKRKERQPANSIVCTRKESSKKPDSKNLITNQQLCQKLKEQIQNDLEKSLTYITQIKSIMMYSQVAQKQPTNEYLVSIFRIRDLVKDEITTKLQHLAKKLTRDEAILKKEIYDARKIEKFC